MMTEGQYRQLLYEERKEWKWTTSFKVKQLLRWFKAERQRNKDAETALIELAAATDGYFIQPGDYSTPAHMEYERKYLQ
jgi:uncharacterized membrane protein YkvA (DUF1232 family)